MSSPCSSAAAGSYGSLPTCSMPPPRWKRHPAASPPTVGRTERSLRPRFATRWARAASSRSASSSGATAPVSPCGWATCGSYDARPASMPHREHRVAGPGRGRRRSEVREHGVVDLEVRGLLELVEVVLGGILARLVAHGRLDLVLHLIEGLRRALFPLRDHDYVVAVLGLDRVADLALLQGEGSLLELGNHPALAEQP